MLLAIQQAYYLHAENPSDVSTLITLADKLGLNVKQFSDDIKSQACQDRLLQQLNHCREMSIYSFPSMVLKNQKEAATLLQIDYNDSQKIIDQIVDH